jgi:predicted proteasome-type protease
MQLPQDRIQIMYNQGMLYHDAELEAQQEERIIGDGLDLLDIESLHALVKKINDKVKLVAKSEDDFAKKKCAMSKIKDKQVGLIRRWRTVYGHLE